MAKKSTSAAAPAIAQPDENVSGYFRKVFAENPGWLKERSNDKLLQRWLTDHPGEKEVPAKVKVNLSNIKSILRSKKRKKVAKVATDSQPVSSSSPVKVARVATGSSKLEALELQIDECLISARHLNKEGLHDVIAMLRKARNAVVWKIGQ
jgi:hypothetical protein